MKKMLLSALVGLMMLLSGQALAGEGTVDLSNPKKDTPDGVEVTTADVILFKESGEYVIKGKTDTYRIVVDIGSEQGISLEFDNVHIEAAQPMVIESAFVVDITLKGSSSLKSNWGTEYSALNNKGHRLVILGDGSLKATGGDNAAGIGGNVGETGIKIFIDSGEVTATSKFGAGIGGGAGGKGMGLGVFGGHVKATSETGAGIGGGAGAEGSNITINAGRIEVQSEQGAGIGGGYMGDGKGIRLYGGTVKAKSVYGAAFGGGNMGSGSEIEIKGGTVTGESEKASAVGAGMNGKAGTGNVLKPEKGPLAMKFYKDKKEEIYTKETNLYVTPYVYVTDRVDNVEGVTPPDDGAGSANMPQTGDESRLALWAALLALSAAGGVWLKRKRVA